jgi:iron-sulfur cluster repair protein YtfE (RIC family)
MTDVLAGAHPDTGDMVVVHDVFRAVFADAARLVGGVAPGDTGRSAIVGSYYGNLLAFLHAHHAGEDELLWPKLLDRCPTEAARIWQIADQHDAVAAGIERAEDCLDSWTAAPDAPRRDDLVGVLSALGAELGTHLADEEHHVLPLAAAHLSVHEWAQLPAHSIEQFDGDKPWLVLGLVQEAMIAAGRTDGLPAHAVRTWEAARPQYSAFMAAVRG